MRLQLQSLLLPSDDDCGVNELYYHREADLYRFDGYFNLFYIEKRKAYTNIENLKLQINIQGCEKLTIMHDENALEEICLDADNHREYIIDLPYKDYNKGVFWFSLTKKETTGYGDPSGENDPKEEISGFYITEIAETDIRHVNIGIDICTYKREQMLFRNLKLLKHSILDKNNLQASSHYLLYVIDNGRSLQNFEEIRRLVNDCSGKLKIYPNKNSGGAGGFTRGMLEILKDRKEYGLTHILMMDDDAVTEPDSLVRIYGFLVTLKDEWKDITIGGEMYREDHPCILYCSGEYWKSGNIDSPSRNTDLRDFANAIMPALAETGHEHEWYSGWWLCCMSLNTVREDNLPIPLFFHHDDIEFGLRNHDKGIVFLNGVGVWHKRTDYLYPTSTRYYDIRNNLIEIALNEKGKKQFASAAKLLFQSLIASAIRLRYKDVKLEYKAFIDFLKGPEWLYRQDPEKLNSKIERMAIRMEPLEDVLNTLSEQDRESAEKQLAEYKKACHHDNTDGALSKKRLDKLLYYITFNGWILPADKKDIQLVASDESPYKGFRKERILMYEPATNKAKAAVRNSKDMREVLNICRKAVLLFIRYFKTACKNWKENVGLITNKAAWERYLKADL